MVIRSSMLLNLSVTVLLRKLLQQTIMKTRSGYLLVTLLIPTNFNL